MTPHVTAGGAARLAAIAVAVLAIAATVLHAGHSGRNSSAPSVSSGANDDPLQAELKRCQLLGEAGAQDDRCLRAWAETRRRFLRPPAPPVLPSTDVVAKPLLPANTPPDGAPADRPSAKGD